MQLPSSVACFQPVSNEALFENIDPRLSCFCRSPSTCHLFRRRRRRRKIYHLDFPHFPLASVSLFRLLFTLHSLLPLSISISRLL